MGSLRVFLAFGFNRNERLIIKTTLGQERRDFLAERRNTIEDWRKQGFGREEDFHERKRLKINYHLNSCNVSILYFVFFERYE